MILATAALLVSQPTEPAYVASGIPYWVGSKVLQMQTHSVTAKVKGERVQFETTTVLKNMTDKAASGKFVVYQYGLNEESIGAKDINPTVEWDRKPVSGSAAKLNGRAGRGYSITINPSSTHSIHIVYSHPLGRGGMDRRTRIVPYDLSGIPTWLTPLNRLNFSLHWDPSEIFQTMPGWAPSTWQVGEKGAYFQASNLERGTVVEFNFYPNTFETPPIQL